MGVGEAIVALGAGERPPSFEQFSAAIDPEWIADALAATDTASVRRRKLPAEHVVWLVIGMGLFRDRSIAQVVHHLDLVVPTPTGARQRVTNAAIVQARDQLGAAPLATLFTQTAQAWALPVAAADRWHGLAVYGLDGTTLRVADTPENVAYFGRPPSRHGEGAGYPQLRLVTLLTLRAHLLAAAAFGPYRTSEVALATQVWATLPEHAVVILDRGFCSYALFHTRATPNRDRHWIVRARSGPTALTQAVVQRFGPGDALVELRPSPATCAKHPDLPGRSASAPSASSAAASAPIGSSPPSAPPPPTRPRTLPRSTTSAGNSNSPSTNSRPTPANASKRCAAKPPPAWRRRSGACSSPTTSSASS